MPISAVNSLNNPGRPGHPTTAGTIAHELFHGVQTESKQIKGPDWLTEAAANYMSHTITGNYQGGFDPISSIGKLSDVQDPTKLNKYSQGSAFLGYLDNKYPGMLPDLFQQDFRTGSNAPFQTVYGQDLQQLWNGFSKAVSNGQFTPETNTLLPFPPPNYIPPA